MLEKPVNTRSRLWFITNPLKKLFAQESRQKLKNFTVAQLRFEKLYLTLAFAVLVASTLVWAYLGARLQASNADQLIDAYLFQSAGAVHGALLPAAHTFLLKWPLFILVKSFGINNVSLGIFTIGSALATVLLLSLFISRIEKRPAVLGTIFLALASVLFLTPAIPAPGNLLPVNMAMLATRNLEYVVYLASLALMIRHFKLRDWQFWLGTALMFLLAASDRLFIYFSLGGAILALIAYALSNGWNLTSFAVRWLVGSASAAVASLLLLAILNWLKVTHIVASGSTTYNLIHSMHALKLGLVYMFSGLLSNFGANPALGTTEIAKMPANGAHNLLTFGFVGFIVNLLVLVVCLASAAWLLVHSFRHNKNADVQHDAAHKLSIGLIWSSLAALGLFVATNHYYAGDGRYLSIFLFAGFIGLATYSRTKNLPTGTLMITGEIITFGILLGLPGLVHTYNVDQKALAPLSARNDLVLQAVAAHKVDYLVGDYWRVVPAKFESRTAVSIAPLANCTQFRQSLTTASWQPNLNKHSFAYLLSLDKGLTDFPSCNLGQVVKAYGRPNSSLVIAGSIAQPKELLLFYDHGIHKSTPKSPAPSAGPATVVPIALGQLPYSSCPVPTILNIVAHEDDDLLFMSPDLIHDIQAGHCIRTVYVTAGDAGAGQFYWLGRQQGSEAAYAKMLGIADPIWTSRVVQVSHDHFITIANPRADSKISLIFMYLPDGNLKGQGFSANKFQSLAKLRSGAIADIDSIYTQSSYTSQQLVDTLTSLMHFYQPSEIRTQSSYVSQTYPDHSDHMTVGSYATQAYDNYEQQQFDNKVAIPLEYYRGYSIHELPPNVSGGDLAEKEAVFLEYARYDGSVCHDLTRCLRDPAYGAYLIRLYQSDQ